MRALVAAAGVVAVILVGCSGRAAAQLCGGDDPPAGSSTSVDFTGLAPGDTRQWPTTVDDDRAAPVALDVTLQRSGPLAEALAVGLERCDQPWVPPTDDDPADCPTGATVVLAPTTSAHVELELPTLAAGQAWYGMFRAHLPASVGNEYQGSTGTVRSLVVWHDVCPATTTTVPPTTVPPTTAPPTTAPTTTPSSSTPATVPVTRPPADGVTRIAVTGGPGTRARPERLPFTGTTATALALAGLVLVVTGATILTTRRRGR